MNDAMRAVGVFFAQRAIEPEPRSQFAVVFLSYFWCRNCSGQADQWIYDLPAKRNNCVMTELFLFVVLTIRHILWTADEDNSSVQRQPQRNAAIRSQLAISSFSSIFFVFFIYLRLYYILIYPQKQRTHNTHSIYTFSVANFWDSLDYIYLLFLSHCFGWHIIGGRSHSARFLWLGAPFFFYIPMLLLFSCPSSL